MVLANQLARLEFRIDGLISSPAVRALSTAEAFSKKMNLPVQTDKRIYEAGAMDLQAVVRELDDRYSTVVLVGHNPGVSAFIRHLTDEPYADLPPAGLAVIDLPLKCWRHTFEGKGLLKNSLSPKNEPLGVQTGCPDLPWKDRIRFWRFQRAQRLEIIMVLVIAALLLLLVIPLIMHASIDSSAMPQQGSNR